MSSSSDRFILRGQTWAFVGDPFEVGPDAAVSHHVDGAVVVAGGMIEDVGPAASIIARRPDWPIKHYGDALIMAGFVDAHVHYPQVEVIGAYGEQLLEWLNRYTFPAEMKFSDPDYAAGAAELFLDQCLRNGITSASVYCTSHPQSVDAFFSAAQKLGLRMAAGKVMMDRNAPDQLLDTAQTGYDQSKTLIERWHGMDRLSYAVTPRFAPTSTPAQLEAAGVLWREHPTCLVQTHMSESLFELEWMRELYPDAPDYLSVYERYGLVGEGANFGHCIHLNSREIAALKASGSGISHCPTSNTFIGSGLFKMNELREGARAIPIGMATDIGGGTSFSMFGTMKTSYEICQLRGYSLHPAKAYYLATVGSADVLRMGDKIGNLKPGHEADMIVIDLKSTPLIAARMGHANDLWEALFIQVILADDRAIRATYSGGRKLYDRCASAALA